MNAPIPNFPNLPGTLDRKAQEALDGELNRTVEAYSLGETSASEVWEKMDALLKAGADINNFRLVVDNSFLIWACRRENPGPEDAELIGKMLKAGAKPDVAASSGMTPLLTALDLLNAGAAALLLDAGANLRAQEKRHDPELGRKDAIYFTVYRLEPLSEGPAQRDAQFECLKLLLARGLAPDKGARDYIYRTSPHLAPLIDGMAEAMELHAAAAQGDAAAVQAALAQGVLADGAARFGGETALAAAAATGHLRVMETLMRGGADLDMISPADGLTPLLQAAAMGQRDAFKMLLDAGADPQVLGGNEDTGFISVTRACANPGMRAFVTDLLAVKAMTLQQTTALNRPLKFKAPGVA